MISLFDTPADSSVLIVLTVLYAVTSSITVFDKRMIQARRDGTLPADEPMLPSWVAIVVWVHWGIGLSIILLNWQYAIVVFVAKFIVSVLPVLEIIGNFLMAPFRPKS
jgi:hypothetical protein